MKPSVVARAGRSTTERKVTASVTEGAARVGLAARGVIYLLVGAIALQIAFGDTSRQADRQGALEQISGKPLGAVLLWALGIGLVGMALWRLSEAVLGAAGPDGHKARNRLLAAGRCAFYAFAAYSVLRFAANGDRGSSSDEQSRDVTAKVLQWPAGQWIVAVGGCAVVVAGVWMGVQALRRSYHDELKIAEMSGAGRRLADVTGVGGGVARGLVFAVVGAFAVRAAVDYDPDRAKGLDDALRSFADTPLGPWLLACVALGLVLFGLFSFVAARRRRV